MNFKNYFSVHSYLAVFLRSSQVSGMLCFALISNLDHAKADTTILSKCSNLQHPKGYAWINSGDTTKQDTTKYRFAEQDPNKIYTSVEQNPKYPDGEGALLFDLSKSLKYPKEAKRNNIQGKVTVNFVVEKDGSISTINVLKGVELGGGLAEAAVKAVEKLKAFSPGLLNGKPARVSYSVPITFHLENDNSHLNKY